MAAQVLDEDRVLCVDGGCIGLVGANGKCRVCGAPGPTSAKRAGSAADADAHPSSAAASSDEMGEDSDSDEDEDEYIDDSDDDDDDDDSDDDDDDEEDDDEDDDDDDDDAEKNDDLPAAADDFDDRELCPDGACVGVLGPTGKCTTCGARRGRGDEEEG